MSMNLSEQDIKSKYTGKTILVTGATGFIASRLIEALGGTACLLRRLSRRAGALSPIEGEAQVSDIAGDLASDEMWDKALDGVEVVFHLAAQTSAYAAEENPAEDIDANLLPMLRLLEACRRKGGCPGIVFAGTVTQAGLTTALPVNESPSDEPVTIYDVHKKFAEEYLEYYSRVGVVSGVTLRLSNVYGPGPKSSSADRGVLNAMILKALRGDTLTVYGKGDRVRDYVYIDDVVRAFLLAGTETENLSGRRFVIGSGKGHTLAEALHLASEVISELTGGRAAVESVPPPSPRSRIEERNFIADCRSFREATGWEAQVSLSEGIRRTAEFLLETRKENI